MKNLIRKADAVLSLLCVVIFTFITIGFYTQPHQVVFYEDNKQMQYMNLYSVKKNEKAVQASSLNGITESNAEISFLGVFPVCETQAVVRDRKYVCAGGDLIGIKIFTDGLLVVATDDVSSASGNISPAKECGIEVGDIITHVNDEIITSVNAFSSVITACEGNNVGLTVKRNDEVYYYSLKPVYCESENKYRCGLWLKDSTAGIGTLTFTDPETDLFASLGHAICDSETKSVLTVNDGDIYDAIVNGCDKGQKGTTGQIKGSFMSSDMGDIIDNNEFGLYGTFSSSDVSDNEMYPLAASNEIKTGNAKIISTVSDKGKQMYDIEIEKISYSSSPESRSLVIRITDPELLAVTGGIVQGMSGSPIIQDGKIVGAVTHVFLNDPTRGYGIFAETMLDTMNSIAE